MGAGLFSGMHAAPAEADALADPMLVLCRNPGRTFAQSDVMLARLFPFGIFELLTGEAWARALGYPSEELDGKSLRELMVEKPAASAVVTALLDPTDNGPLDVTLRCKDERHKFFRFHRRYDAYEQSVFVVADELS